MLAKLDSFKNEMYDFEVLYTLLWALTDQQWRRFIRYESTSTDYFVWPFALIKLVVTLYTYNK